MNNALAFIKPDIIHVIQNAGINLKRSGKYYKAPCPFHQEKTPSFIVYPNNTFHCFGCGESGDSIDFIMKHSNMTFKDALAYLGINNGIYKPPKLDKEQILKKELITKFRQWEHDYYNELAEKYRCFNALKLKFKTMDEAEKHAEFYHKIPIYEYHMDILFVGDDEEKYELFREVNNGEI